MVDAACMSVTTTTAPGQIAAELRAARGRAGLTRPQVATLAGCSLAHLANLEQGAIPNRSAALGRIRVVLDAALNDSRPAGERAAVETSSTAGTGRHARE